MPLILVWFCSHFLSVIRVTRALVGQVVKATSRSVFGQCGELCACLATFSDFHRRVRAAHVSLYPAWMRRIDFDFGVAQFVREMHCERIKGCLGSIIGKDLKRIN